MEIQLCSRGLAQHDAQSNLEVEHTVKEESNRIQMKARDYVATWDNVGVAWRNLDPIPKSCSQ